MEIYYGCLFFTFGLIMGSFYNVCAYRLPKKESLMFPSSHCPKCNHFLKWYELIPVLSYIIQRGKCRNCKEKISPFYMIFELFTGILFLLSYLVFGITIKTAIAITFVSIIDIIIISDILYTIINDGVLIVGGIFLLAELLIEKIVSLDNIDFIIIFKEFGMILFNGIIPFIIMFLIKKMGDYMFKKESMGGGDIKLMFIFGIVLGSINAISTIFIASFIALPISLIILKMKKTHEIPFGPFLSIAALIILFLKIDIISFFEI